MRLELDQSTTSIPVTGDPSVINENEAREALEQGIKAAQSGDRARARVALLRASDLDPNSENAWLWLASISEYPEELLVFLSNVLDINPNNARALEWTAATRSLLAKTFVQRGIDAVEENQVDFAVECFNKGLEYDQHNAMAWMWLASLSDSDQGKITYLEKVVEIEPENVEALAGIEAAKISINTKLMAQARTAAVSGQRDEAIEITKAMIAESDNCADAWMLRSHLVDSFDEKIACLDKVLEIDPENTAALVSRESLAAIVGMVAVEPAAAASEVAEPEISAGESNTVETAEANVATGDKGPTQELEMPEGFQFESDAVRPEPEPDLSLTMMGTIYNIPESNYFESPADFVQVEETSTFMADDEGLVTDTDVSISEMFVEPLEVFDDAPESDGFRTIPAPICMTSESMIDFSSTEPMPVDAFEIPMPLSSLPEVPVIPSGYETTVERRSEPRIVAADSHSCPFCNATNDAQSISCRSCLAVLTLSDLEMLLANQHADKFVLRDAVGRMQQEQNARPLSESELTMLGIGHLNLRNLQFGYDCLQEAAK
ncbi:MAG: hypothetical protein ABI539_02790, partial [Acidobacteriota bacterium]